MQPRTARRPGCAPPWTLHPAARPEQRTRPAEVIRRSASEMDRLIADLLDDYAKGGREVKAGVRRRA
jgi:hypothetical protein